MTLIEEVKAMMQQNMSEADIVSNLQRKGISQSDAINAITQAKIKSAVDSQEDSDSPQSQEGYEGMQPSILNPQSMSQPSTEEYSPEQYQAQEQYSQAPQYQASYQQQDQYSSYSPGVSSDTISEIAEQVASEKIAPIRTQLEKAIDIKNTVQSKIDYIDERLTRIEKIIDRLQLSILQRVGEYVSNVEDLKKELVETQKSFKAVHKK